MGWTDGAAFLDWAALRPMTEMEFERPAGETQIIHQMNMRGEQPHEL